MRMVSIRWGAAPCSASSSASNMPVPSLLVLRALLLVLLVLGVFFSDGARLGVEAFQQQQQPPDPRSVFVPHQHYQYHPSIGTPRLISSSFLQHNGGRRRLSPTRTNLHPTATIIAATTNAATVAASASVLFKQGITTVGGRCWRFVCGFSTATFVPPTTQQLIRGMALALGTLVVVKNYRKLVDPNSVFQEDDVRGTETAAGTVAPLPPRAASCPLIGNQILVGSRSFGTGYFYHQMAKKLHYPRIWLYSFLGHGGVVLCGGSRLKTFLQREFLSAEDGGVYAGMKASKIITADSLLSALRRLVGAAMTPARVAASIPTLQAAAERQVANMLVRSSSEVTIMDDICNEYTLDVAWKQLLGLDLPEEEIPHFRAAVEAWIAGFTSLRMILNLGNVEQHPTMVAKRYIEALIRAKITTLETQGRPDASTLSGMVFARDDEEAEEAAAETETTTTNTNQGGPGHRQRRRTVALQLTTEQIVENAFLLILAGSETSATTLTNAILALGLHPTAWQTIVQEQRALYHQNQNHNRDGGRGGCEGRVEAGYRVPLTQQQLEHECPYLDAVVREVMRIKPIPSGVPRYTKDTLVIEGYQIPKGWMVNWNILLTHELDPLTRVEDGSHMTMETGFVPDRWLKKATRPTTDFMPMGAGPRYCLGSTLAYAEMKVFLAVLAQAIDFDLVDDPKQYHQATTTDNKKKKKKRKNIVWKRMSIIPKPANGVPVRIRAATAPVVTATTPTAPSSGAVRLDVISNKQEKEEDVLVY